jgi:sterol desaturase/sphingolipid hydroxylase (fatty acid hydroxylase superfamily)
MDNFVASETIIRMGIFVSVLLLMLLWERSLPRRVLTTPKRIRWVSNLGLAALNQLLIRVLILTTGIGMAEYGQALGWGLFNWLEVGDGTALIGSVLMLDLVIYFQHRLFHAVPLFWRLHRMHHADIGFDTTTGVRFHPLEALLSMTIKLAAIIALGAPPVAVLVFEVILNATSLFNHGNVRIPAGFDRVLRWVLVTPDMHRVHHSSKASELNRNFGFNLPWWDHLFGSYQDQPEAGHEHMQIGLTDFRSEKDLKLDRLLIQPFINTRGGA